MRLIQTVKRSKMARGFSFALASSLVCVSVNATELVYFPLNPSFGGSPLNGQVLLNSALATNKHKAPDEDDFRFEDQTPLDIFNETLERAVLGQLAAAATSRIISSDGRLVPGNLETENFYINIVSTGNGRISITTTDKLTGNTNTFEVMQ